MASGIPGRDLRGGYVFGAGSAVQMPYQQRSDGGAAIGAAGLLKRSLTEMERQQQMQHAIYLRSVKQKTHLFSTSPFSRVSSADLSGASTTTTNSSILSSLSSASVSTPFSGQRVVPNSTTWSFQEPIATVLVSDSVSNCERESTMANRLLELERQLLEDDEDGSISGGSAVTSNDWNETMQKLMSPPPPPPLISLPTNQNPLSPSSTTSTSSSSGSSSSCAPPPSRQMLLDTAKAIAEGNNEIVAANLAVLKKLTNIHGDPDQRLTAMMVTALESRINPPAPGNPLPDAVVCSAEHQAAFHMLYEVSPCFKLGLMAANLAILEATKDQPKIHIIDFDIGQGGQLASLIHLISERRRQSSPARSAPPCLKITAVCDLIFPLNTAPSAGGASNLRLVGDRLAKLAEHLGVGLLFTVVSGRTQELNHSTLLCEPGEALAVNFPFFLSRIADESVSPANPRDEILRRVKSLSPLIVTLTEQEINGNTAPFATRFSEAAAHYGALLESLDATASRESCERGRIESCLSRKAANSVAMEGADRVDRCEVYGKWRARMGMAGFISVPIGSSISEPVKLRLAAYKNNPGFTLKEETAWIGCGWMGRVLTVTSTWR